MKEKLYKKSMETDFIPEKEQIELIKRQIEKIQAEIAAKRERLEKLVDLLEKKFKAAGM